MVLANQGGMAYLWIPFFLCSALIFGAIRLFHHAATVAEWRRPRPTGHLAAYSGDGGWIRRLSS